MSAFALALALLAGLAQGEPPTPAQPAPETTYFKTMELAGYDSTDKTLQVYVPLQKLDKSKVSPKHQWEFEWSSAGLVRTSPGSSWSPRFRVFEQFRDEGELGPRVVRLLLRLWDFNVKRLRLDHGEAYRRLVDVYLAYGGEPGGEQLFTVDPTEPNAYGKANHVNTVYIYQVTTFTEPFEMVREVAHEYGHATIPPIGIYSAPEDWANGLLGERLYIQWLRDELAAKRLTSYDMLGGTQASLDAYLAAKVAPDVKRIALNGPDWSLLTKRTEDAMKEYLALASYAERVLPPRAFARSLVLTGSQKAEDYNRSVVSAATEQSTWSPRWPAGLAKKPIWLPVGKGTLQGGKALKRKGSWVLVQPTAAKVVIRNAP